MNRGTWDLVSGRQVAKPVGESELAGYLTSHCSGHSCQQKAAASQDFGHLVTRATWVNGNSQLNEITPGCQLPSGIHA